MSSVEQRHKSPVAIQPGQAGSTRPGRARSRLHLVVAVLAAIVVVGGGALWTNAFGAADRLEHLRDRVERFLAGPPPDRPTRPTVLVTPTGPGASRSGASLAASATPGATPIAGGPDGSATGSATPEATPYATPRPATPEPRRPVDIDVVADPDAIFVSELRDDWCAVAGVQTVLAFRGKADTSDEFQRRLAGRVHEWESWQDSHNGEWGPAAMAEALAAHGVDGYDIRAYRTRADALRDAAAAIEATRAPAILLTWRGAHTWVMSGFRADADPARFADAQVEGAYIVDPWFPRISTIWGPSDPPGTFQDSAEMVRNYLPWKRPEGRYPDRDGLFVAVVPTQPIGP